MRRLMFCAVGTVVALGSTMLSAGVASAVSSTPFLQQVGTFHAEGVGGVAVSSCGSVFVGGNTYGAFPGRKHAGQSDGFLIKYSAKGTQQWVRQFGTTGQEFVTGVATSWCGSPIYVVGHTDGEFPKRTNEGGVDGFIAKYSSGGSLLWVKQFGTSGDDLVRGISISSSGWLYLTGSTTGSFPGFVNAGGSDGFIAKFSSGGTMKWVEQLGTSADDEFAGIATDKLGNAYVTGETKGAFTLSSGGVDGVVLKVDKNGVEQWLTQFGTASFDHSLGVAVAKTGEVYIAGYTGGNLDGGGIIGAADAFLAQVDSTDGSINWLDQFGTTAEDHAVGVAVTKDGLIFVAGLTYGVFPTLTNYGGADGFAAIYNAGGVVEDLEQHGTSGDENVSGVAVARSGDPVIAGSTQGSFPGFLNAGNADAYVIDFGLAETL